MDKDTKILLMAVVIILVALVSFNLSDLTGKVTSEASVTVDTGSFDDKVIFTSDVDTVKLVTVELLLGNEVVNEKMDLYMCNPRQVERRMSASHALDLCGRSKCGQSDLKPSYDYKVYGSLKDGYYCFIAKKDGTEVATSNRFKVEHA